MSTRPSSSSTPTSGGTSSVRTYSRKPVSRSSAQFDSILIGTKSGGNGFDNGNKSTAHAAVAVTRWGQTTFTSVRRHATISATENGKKATADDRKHTSS